jgi:hypothetical protein
MEGIVRARSTSTENDYQDVILEEKDLNDFLAAIRFFPTPPHVATRILRLNQELGDSFIDAEIADLSQVDSGEAEMFERTENWVNRIIKSVSSVLFHEEHGSIEHEDASSEELSLFQKTVSERIYDHLSFLSLSPHAKSGGVFSLREELTEGIAEDLGLGVYRHDSKISEDFGTQVHAALCDLACEFQRWLVNERSGLYSAGWGEIRARGTQHDEPANAGTIVWLDPDVETPQFNNTRQTLTASMAR